MKRILALTLALVLCFSLCGCGEKSAKIDELKTLIQENPYSCEEGEYVNIDLVKRYQTIVNELLELGVTTEDCPELEYAQAVADLSEYFDDVPLVKAGMATTENVGEANGIISSAITQYKSDGDRVAFRDAMAYDVKELFEGASAAAAEYNTTDAVQELVDTLDKLALQANNIGGLVYGGHSSTMINAVTDIYDEAKEAYNAILIDVVDLLAEIREKEGEIDSIYEELQLGQD